METMRLNKRKLAKLNPFPQRNKSQRKLGLRILKKSKKDYIHQIFENLKAIKDNRLVERIKVWNHTNQLHLEIDIRKHNLNKK